jgi:radical SAM superfamily enzyme YgiQ (UPF0313 family)
VSFGVPITEAAARWGRYSVLLQKSELKEKFMLNMVEGSESEQVLLPRHPLGSKARVLLTSVFGPYAQDDEHGGRAINPMELYHNQVTRVQGAFSLRMFHRSWGLIMIQGNITAPCTLLDFPTLDRFTQELQRETYDVIGISAIVPNFGKVKKMCELIRRYQPKAEIVVGGHVANIPDLASRVDADYAVVGEGIRWFREYLGENVAAPIHHPRLYSCFGSRMMGLNLPETEEDVAATLIPSVGCPLGCDFCATSAMFGGKGKSIHFFPTGDDLFKVMCDLERDLKVKSFFVMDENFLLQKPRALCLLELMEANNKAWALYVFTSAKVLQSYTLEQLIGLGVSWVWMGLEGRDSQYSKKQNVDTVELVRSLQANGIRVLGSSIIGLAEHTPENMPDAIEYAVEHDTEFHQFMLYTPLPGTPLFRKHKEQGTLVDPELAEPADSHGQCKFQHIHEHIPAGMETDFLIQAFTRDFVVNGPSVIRVARTTLAGWKAHHNHPNLRVRERYLRETSSLGSTHAGALWAARRWYRNDPTMSKKIDAILQDVYACFGWKSRLVAPAIGMYIHRCLVREDARLRAGWTYEPETFYERARQNERAEDPAAEAACVPNPIRSIPEPT